MSANNELDESAITTLLTPDFLKNTKFFPSSGLSYVKINFCPTNATNIDPNYLFILTFRIVPRIPPEIRDDPKSFVYIITDRNDIVPSRLVLIEGSNTLAIKPILPLKKDKDYTVVVDFKHQSSIGIGKRLASMHKTFPFHTKADAIHSLPSVTQKIKPERCTNTVGTRQYTQTITKALSHSAPFSMKRIIVRQAGITKNAEMIILHPKETLSTFKTKIYDRFKISEQTHDLRLSVVLSIVDEHSYIFPIDSDLYFQTFENSDMIFFRVVEKKQDDSLILEKELTVDEKIEKKFEEAKNTGNLFDLTSCEDD